MTILIIDYRNCVGFSHVDKTSITVSIELNSNIYFSICFRFFQEEPIQHDFSGVTEFVLKGHGFMGVLL